jgi:hypothetical protein
MNDDARLISTLNYFHDVKVTGIEMSWSSIFFFAEACMTTDKKSTQKTFDDIIATFLKNAPAQDGCPKYKVS